MLSLSNIKSSGAAVHYYENDDYYVQDSPEHKEISEWYGKGADTLNLKGPVEKADFKKILEGDLPNGVQLGRKENDKLVHAPGLDATFSAPKSVSIQAEVFGDNKIYGLHKKAVLKTLNYIEKNLVETRKTMDGELVYEKADNIIAAMFRHNTSRNLDPQLHTHCVLANAIQRNDGEWRSAFFGKIFDNKLLLGQIYRSELAYELEKSGYQLRITGNKSAFELKNIPDSLIDMFSSRSKEIKIAAAEFEMPDAKFKAKLTLQTRVNKKEIDKEILQAKWNEVVQEHKEYFEKTEEKNSLGEKSGQNQIYKGGHKSYKEAFIYDGIDNIKNLIGDKWEKIKEKVSQIIPARMLHISDSKENYEHKKTILSKYTRIKSNTTAEPIKTSELALNYAIDHLSERSSVWKRDELLSSALHYITGKVGIDELSIELNNYFAAGKLLLTKADPEKYGLYLTTKEALSIELKTISLMKEGKDTLKRICSRSSLVKYFNDAGVKLNQGQQNAAELMLTTKDRVIGIQGFAGTGKTYMLQHANTLAEKSGFKVIGMAPSNSAAKTLEVETGIKSQTLQRFLFQFEGVIKSRGTKEGREKMREEFKNAILVVDEASLASTSQLNGLLEISNKLGARVVLVGDTKQLNAVEAGKPFYQLCQSGMQTAKMEEILRQKNIELRGAIRDVIAGDIKGALKKSGVNVIEVATAPSALEEKTVRVWQALTKEERQNTLITAPMHKTREGINQGIRNVLKEEGVLKGNEFSFRTLENISLTRAQSFSINEYHAGLKVLFNRDYKSIKITKGDYLEVSEVVRDKGIVILKKPNGDEIGWRPDKIAGQRSGTIGIFKEKEIILQIGDCLRWTKNDKQKTDKINSGIFKINSISNEKINITHDSGKVETLERNDPMLKHIDYAYAMTVHASQGRTYDRIIGVIDDSHANLTNQKIFYVTLSRARYSATLITGNKDKLSHNLENNDGERIAATEHQGIKYTHLKENNIFDGYNARPNEIAASIYEKGLNLTNANKIKENILHNLKSSTLKSGANTKTYIKSEPQYEMKDIYPVLYNRVSDILPEFGFVQKGNHYVSTTEAKVDGSSGKKGKVYIYANNPGVMVDYTRGSSSIWSYVKENHLSSTSNAGIMRYFIEASGLKVSNLSKAIKPNKVMLTNIKKEPTINVDGKLLNDINSFSQTNLFSCTNKVLAYLQENRKYTDATIKNMGLGFINSHDSLGRYLKKLGWPEDKINEGKQLLGSIGRSHKLVIPYKDNNGKLVGFAARNIFHKEGDALGKYMYSKGLAKSQLLFNIHNNTSKELVIVEGIFDSLNAQANGLSNVVTLGGTGFNERMAKLMQSKGIESLVLCLDNDEAGKKAMTKVIDTMTKVAPEVKLKLASLPKGIKDPDQLIKDIGINALRDVVSKAQDIKASSPSLSKQAFVFEENNAIFNNMRTKAIEVELEK